MAAQSLVSRHSRPATGRHNRLGDRFGKSVGGMAWFLPDSGGRHRTVARNRVLAENSPPRLGFDGVSRTRRNPLLEVLAATTGRDACSRLPFTFVSLFLHCRLSAPFLLFPSTGFSLLAAPMSTVSRPSPIHVFSLTRHESLYSSPFVSFVVFEQYPLKTRREKEGKRGRRVWKKSDC